MTKMKTLAILILATMAYVAAAKVADGTAAVLGQSAGSLVPR